MKRLTRACIILGLVVAVLVFLMLYLLTPAAPPQLVNVSFGGFTNQAGVLTATLILQNQSPVAVRAMDHYFIETPEMPSYTATNHIIGAGHRFPTGTKVIVAAGGTGRLLIPVPSEGNRWKVSLEFARANLQTRLAEYLQRPHGAWIRYVPNGVRAIYIVRSGWCEFSRDAKHESN